MTDEYAWTVDLLIDRHVTVEVDEQGTVAAAATAAGIQRLSTTLPIVLDHPFLFFIRDNLTGAILFTGRVADPTAK